MAILLLDGNWPHEVIRVPNHFEQHAMERMMDEGGFPMCLSRKQLRELRAFAREELGEDVPAVRFRDSYVSHGAHQEMSPQEQELWEAWEQGNGFTELEGD